MITLACPCIKRYDLLEKFLASAERGSVRPDKYVVVDNGGKLHNEVAEGRLKLPVNTETHWCGKNIGVSATWNKILRENPDWVIISNDDVELHERTIESLVQAADETDADFLYPSFNPGAMFCVFLIKHSCVDKIGYFDERFWPAYFEDNDYHRRMKLGGVKELQVANASYDHVVSASLKTNTAEEMEQHHKNFRRNQNYYHLKWGGLPGAEIYDVPKDVPT